MNIKPLVIDQEIRESFAKEYFADELKKVEPWELGIFLMILCTPIIFFLLDMVIKVVVCQ